jgi:hypothetical protein
MDAASSLITHTSIHSQSTPVVRSLHPEYGRFWLCAQGAMSGMGDESLDCFKVHESLVDNCLIGQKQKCHVHLNFVHLPKKACCANHECNILPATVPWLQCLV